MDISGFKQLMNQNKAIVALDCLYRNGYYALQNNINVEGLFVSDSGILFINHQNGNMTVENQLKQLLSVIKVINDNMLNEGYMLTTSVAFGEFSYHQRIEFPGIEKNPVYGHAYVSAFLDNENGLPRIQPGQCRIVLNPALTDIISKQDLCTLNLPIREKRGDNKHLYYYWNVNDPDRIKQFETDYADAYQAKFASMLQALKNARHG